ncbi:MAG: hypothetical protein Q8O67_02740 [Deltaproteobacteria bacterium]|nr:hypothetical protein [Deltaproteobacteria bacterium]
MTKRCGALVVLWIAACGEPPVVDLPPECTTVDGCAALEVCIKERCEPAPRCLGIDDWPFCSDTLDALQPGAGRTAVCESDGVGLLDSHCRVACEIDAQCSADSLCTDFGNCVPGLKRPTPGIPRGAHAPLLAGVGEVILNVPLTTSLGGLSARAGPGDGRWADGMDPAVGHIEGLWARAASLDAGDGRFLVVRLPIIFPTGALTEAIAQGLEEATGEDWRDALVVSATHTHSGPARFLPLLGESEAVLGPFGIGTFRQEVFDLIVQASVDAAVAAIQSQQPASLGWTIVEGFDTEDRIASDRRSESPQFDDNRALLVRVDDDAGLPLFVLTSFGVHPTENGSQWATNDVVGGVERAIEDEMFALAGRVVPALFLAGNGGSMSPSAGGQGFAVPVSNTATGAFFLEEALPALLALETKNDVVVQARAHRFAVTTQLLGYEPGEWFNDGTPPFGGEVTYGGLNCFTNAPADDAQPFDAHLTRDDMDCGISFHTFLFNHPPSVFQRTQISAVNLDGLALLTLPGELSMELSWGLAAELQRTDGLDPLAVFTLGYANDHIMYLLPTSLDEDAPPWPGYTGPAPRTFPPFAFSALRGGFEADTSIFGDRLGDYIVQETVTAWQRLQQDAPRSLEAAPPVYSLDVKAPIDVDETPADDAGLVLVDLPSALPRHAVTPFAFIGGDVAVDGQGPTVALLTEGGAPVLLPSGRAFSTDHAVFPLGVVREAAGEWRWTAFLDLPPAFPAGRFKLQATGRARIGGVDAAYTAESAVFTVAPAALSVSARREGADVVVVVGLQTDVPSLDQRAVSGRLGLLDLRVPSGQLAPLPAGSLLPAAVVVRGSALAAATVVEAVVEGLPVTEARITGVAPEAFVVDVTDVNGNSGSVDVGAVP